MAITSDRDKLRLALGDRDSSNYIFNDDELDSFLSDEGNVASATLAAARSAEAYFSRAYDIETDGQVYKRSQIATSFKRIVDRLEAAGVNTSGVKYTFGMFAATKIDGYTQDIAADEVSQAGTAFSNPRQRFYQVEGLDQLP